jgi:hypothetical protein
MILILRNANCFLSLSLSLSVLWSRYIGDIRIIDTVDMILQRFCHALHISWSCMRVISHLLLMKLVMSKFDNGFVWSRWSGAEQQQHCVTSTTRMKQRFVIKQRLCIDIEERHSYWNGLQDFSLSIFQVGLINVSHSFGVLSFMSSELCGRFCKGGLHGMTGVFNVQIVGLFFSSLQDRCGCVIYTSPSLGYDR